MDQNEMFQLILKEVKDSNKEVMNELSQLKEKVDRIEKVVNSHTDILNTFKFDVDFIAQRQTQTDMKVNRIENLLKL